MSLGESTCPDGTGNAVQSESDLDGGGNRDVCDPVSREASVPDALLASAAITSLLSTASADDTSLAPSSDETVFFRGWQYKTDIVQDNVERYNKALSGKVDYATVTGDYPAIMEQNLMAGAELDVLYANPSQAGRYYDGGWILPADELPNIDAIRADMYPNILEAWTYKGKLLGLSYFVSTRGDARQSEEIRRTRHVRPRFPKGLGRPLRPALRA